MPQGLVAGESLALKGKPRPTRHSVACVARKVGIAAMTVALCHYDGDIMCVVTAGGANSWLSMRQHFPAVVTFEEGVEASCHR